jgi:hypothetical protein
MKLHFFDSNTDWSVFSMSTENDARRNVYIKNTYISLVYMEMLLGHFKPIRQMPVFCTILFLISSSKLRFHFGFEQTNEISLTMWFNEKNEFPSYMLSTAFVEAWVKLPWPLCEWNISIREFEEPPKLGHKWLKKAQ